MTLDWAMPGDRSRFVASIEGDLTMVVIGIDGHKRMHLHELDPAIEPASQAFRPARTLTSLAAELEGREELVARLARELLRRCQQLTTEIRALEKEIASRVTTLAP